MELEVSRVADDHVLITSFNQMKLTLLHFIKECLIACESLYVGNLPSHDSASLHGVCAEDLADVGIWAGHRLISKWLQIHWPIRVASLFANVIG